MKKVKVIIGSKDTGKTLTARQLVKQKGLKTVFLEQKKFMNTSDLHWIFMSCEVDTQLICIDEIRNFNSLEYFVFAFQEEIEVNKQSQEPFYITPQEMILVCSEEITKEQIESLGASLTRRIELMECTKETLEKQLQSLK